MNLKLEIVKRVSANETDFVDFWSKQNSYNLEHLYDENIKKTPLDKAAILALYKWKNGSEKIARMKM